MPILTDAEVNEIAWQYASGFGLRSDVPRLCETIRVLRARIAELEKNLAREEAECLQQIDQCDLREDVINRLCNAAGHKFCFDFEWTSLYGFEEAIDDVQAKCAAKDARIAELEAAHAKCPVPVFNADCTLNELGKAIIARQIDRSDLK